MEMPWTAFLLTFSFLHLSSGDWRHLFTGDCEPIRQGEESPSDCCDVKLFPAEFKTNRDACLEKTPAFKEDQDCADQCMLESSGVMTGENKLDRGKLWDLLRSKVEIGKENDKALEDCLTVYAAKDEDYDDDDDDDEDDKVVNKVVTNSPCKSGAKQFLQCYMRQVFINCPEKFLKESKGCSKLQKKAERCEKLEIKLEKKLDLA